MADTYYWDYLALDEILGAQRPESVRHGQPAHDETLFIITHQAYELWFKQILHDLDFVLAKFSATALDDRDLGAVVGKLDRIGRIWQLLTHQLDVLETMTPLDFLDFRDYLIPASGFQSVQFRLVEARLGVRSAQRAGLDNKPFAARLKPEHEAILAKTESEPSLLSRVGSWLERTPFLNHGTYRFSEIYKNAVLEMLAREQQIVRENKTLNDAARELSLRTLAGAAQNFEALFSGDENAAPPDARLSRKALQAALFINLYRDEPVLQLPFKLLSQLMDVDELMTLWRHRHALMVQRMIGARVGTGGSSGHEYLRDSAAKSRVFLDLFSLSTYLLPRPKLPPLPPELRQAMGYRYSET